MDSFQLGAPANHASDLDAIPSEPNEKNGREWPGLDENGRKTEKSAIPAS